MRFHRVLALKGVNEGWLLPLHVVGNVEELLTKLIESGEVAPLTRDDFQLEVRDELYLDPGGVVKMEEPSTFTVEGLPCAIRPHKLQWVTRQVREAEEPVPGWLRIEQGPSSWGWVTYFPTSFREPLLCSLMAMEFEPGVKESRDECKDLSDQIFLQGHLARPAPDGGWYLARRAEDHELPEDWQDPPTLNEFFKEDE